MIEKMPEILIQGYTVIEEKPGYYLHTFHSNRVLEPDFLSHDGKGVFLIPTGLAKAPDTNLIDPPEYQPCERCKPEEASDE